MAISYIGKGAFQGGAGALTVPWAASHAAGDIGILIVETANQPIATPSGWTQIGETQAYGTAAAANAGSLQVWYRFATSAAEADVSVPDSGDHTCAQIHVWRGVDSYNPLDVSAIGSTGSGTDVNLTGFDTQTDGAEVVAVVQTDRDAASTSNFSDWANASLASITERHDQAIGNQDGGGFGIASGPKTSAGTVSATTATGPNEEFCWLHFALREVQPIAVAFDSGSGIAAATTATGSVGYGLAVRQDIGTAWDSAATVWDSGATVWDGGATSWDGTVWDGGATSWDGTITPIVAATSASATTDIVLGDIDVEMDSTTPIATATTASGTVALELDVVAAAPTVIAAATSAAQATVESSFVTIWDSGTTVWDGGATVWDAVLGDIAYSSGAVIAAATSASGSLTYTLVLEAAEPTTITAATTASGAVEPMVAYTVWDSGATIWDGGATLWDVAEPLDLVIEAVSASPIAAATAASAALAEDLEITAVSASPIVAQTSGSAGVQKVFPGIPVYYEDADHRANTLWVTVDGSLVPATAIYRGAILLWGASQTQVTGTLSAIEAATTVTGDLGFALAVAADQATQIEAATTANGGLDLRLDVQGAQPTEIAAATTGAGAVTLELDVQAVEPASIAAATTASASTDLIIEVQAAAPTLIEALTTLSGGDTEISVPPTFVVTGVEAAPITAATLAQGDLAIRPPIEGEATIEAATTATGDLTWVLAVEILCDGPALIDAALEATGAVSVGTGISGLAQIAAETTASGELEFVIPITIEQALELTPIVAATQASADLWLGYTYAVPPPERLFVVKAETRIFTVAADDRRFIVRSERT